MQVNSIQKRSLSPRSFEQGCCSMRFFYRVYWTNDAGFGKIAYRVVWSNSGPISKRAIETSALFALTPLGLLRVSIPQMTAVNTRARMIAFEIETRFFKAAPDPSKSHYFMSHLWPLIAMLNAAIPRPGHSSILPRQRAELRLGYGRK